MRIRTGCDLVHIENFERTTASVAAKAFTPHELSDNPSTQTLAGLFAAKDAVIKALDLPAGSWQGIEILKGENGKPEVKLAEHDPKIASSDISISHDGDYVMAIATFLLEA